MKSLLLLSLLVLCISQKVDEEDEDVWKKRSIYEDDLFIDRSFKTAAKDYIKNKPGLTEDDLFPLTVHSQLIESQKYKVCFIDTKNNTESIQEYKVYVHGKELLFEIFGKKQLEKKNEKIDLNDKTFVKFEKTLTKNLKGTTEELKNINNAGIIENDETLFYIVNADTKEGEHNYVVYQDKESNEFYDSVRIN